MARRIYTASRTKHAGRWRALRDAGEPIHCTWIDEAGLGESASMRDLWWRCVTEAATATALVVFVENEEDNPLKGGLVEVGAALGNGVPVFTVGPVQGSWTNHPLVTRCMSIVDALNRAHAFGG